MTLRIAISCLILCGFSLPAIAGSLGAAGGAPVEHPPGGSKPLNSTGKAINQGPGYYPYYIYDSRHPSIDWAMEDRFWKRSYKHRPYYKGNTAYSHYRPAYRYGVDLFRKNHGLRYSELNQQKLKDGWEYDHGNSNLDWDEAEPAVRDAYNRLYIELME